MRLRHFRATNSAYLPLKGGGRLPSEAKAVGWGSNILISQALTPTALRADLPLSGGGTPASSPCNTVSSSDQVNPMGNLDSLLHGFGIAVTLPHLALMITGVLLGILVGVLPGLGAPNGVSLLLPLTFGMAPVSAIILLSSM